MCLATIVFFFFKQKTAYEISACLVGSEMCIRDRHGVGVSVVNALSEWLKLTIYRDGKEHFIEFRHGDPVEPLKIVGESNKRGTIVHFLAAKETFGLIEFHFDILAKRLRELSFLNNGVKIALI